MTTVNLRNGMPATGEDAALLLRELHDRQRNEQREEHTMHPGQPEIEPAVVVKTCTNCRTSKPTSDFYDRQSQCKACLAEKQKARKARKAGKPQAATALPAPPQPNGHHSDPRLSQLRELADYLEADLETAAGAWSKVIELAQV